MRLTRGATLLIGLPLILAIAAVPFLWAHLPAATVINGSLALGPLNPAVVLGCWAVVLGFALGVLGGGDFQGPGSRRQLATQTALLTAGGLGLDACAMSLTWQPPVTPAIAALSIGVLVPVGVDVLVFKTDPASTLERATHRLRYLPLLLAGIGIPVLVLRVLLYWWQIYSAGMLFLLLITAVIQAAVIRKTHGGDGVPSEGRRPWMLVLAALAAVFIPTAVAGVLARQADLPRIGARSTGQEALAVGWLAERYPVIVHPGAVVDCLDDHCVKIKITRIPLPAVESPFSRPTAAVGPDGSVTVVSEEHLIHCDRLRQGCRSVTPTALAGASLSTVAVSASGTFLLSGKVVESGDDSARMVMAVARCDDPYCATSTVTSLGEIVTGRLLSAPLLKMGFDQTGTLVVVIPGNSELWIGRCQANDCELAGFPSGQELPYREVLNTLGLVQRPGVRSHASIVAGKEGYYALGVMPETYEAALFICADSACADVRRRLPLPSARRNLWSGGSYGPGPEIRGNPLAVHQDGRVIVTDNVFLRSYVVQP
jgi:hypothetical protein